MLSSLHVGVPSPQPNVGLSFVNASFFNFIHLHSAHIQRHFNCFVSKPMSFSSPLPPISSVLPSATQYSTSPPPLLPPRDAVATSAHIQHFSAVRQLTRDLQQLEPANRNVHICP